MSHPPDDEAPTEVDVDRDLLMGVAFRILGSQADAADAVQEGYSRWYTQTPEARCSVVSPTGWLVTVVSRICLDALKSARRRRERYVGPWLPEPLPTTAGPANPQRSLDPEQQVALDESVTTAMLIVMDTMSPAERVAFVLHDVFGFSFAEIATILARSPTACRQLASTGRRKARASQNLDNDLHRVEASVVALRDAWSSRDLPALVNLLDPDAVAVVDGGGLVSAPTHPVIGPAAIGDLLLDVVARAPDLSISTAEVNKRAGLVVRDSTRKVLAVVTVGVDSGQILNILVTRNPAKLTAWS